MPQLNVNDELEDVAEERERVEALTPEECATKTPIVVRNLQKTYPAIDNAPPKVAVRNLTLGIDKGECFGLLGPNGEHSAHSPPPSPTPHPTPTQLNSIQDC